MIPLFTEKIHGFIHARRDLRFSYEWRCTLWASGLWPYVVLYALPPFSGSSEKASITYETTSGHNPDNNLIHAILYKNYIYMGNHIRDRKSIFWGFGMILITFVYAQLSFQMRKVQDVVNVCLYKQWWYWHNCQEQNTLKTIYGSILMVYKEWTRKNNTNTVYCTDTSARTKNHS
jgi:hypothetical protein